MEPSSTFLEKVNLQETAGACSSEGCVQPAVSQERMADIVGGACRIWEEGENTTDSAFDRRRQWLFCPVYPADRLE